MTCQQSALSNIKNKNREETQFLNDHKIHKHHTLHAMGALAMSTESLFCLHEHHILQTHIRIHKNTHTRSFHIATLFHSIPSTPRPIIEGTENKINK